MIEDHSSCFFELALALLQLRQRGKSVKVLGNVRIVNSAIVLRHGKGGMPKELLEHERIAAAVHQILAGKGVAEQVNTGFLNATRTVIVGDCKPQGVL